MRVRKVRRLSSFLKTGCRRAANYTLAIVLTLDKPATIGRNPDLWSVLCIFVFVPRLMHSVSSYVVNDALVSGVHCKLYAYVLPQATLT